MKQEEIIARLAAGETFGGPPCRRIDTHISVIFLTGTKAYKLKRAHQTTYLDYRTLAARKRGCEREIELNRRTAPAIYLRAVPVTIDPQGRLEIGGAGTPAEWLVEMRRFDPDETFDALARDGALTRSMLIETAEQIADLHGRAPVISEAGFSQTLARIVAGNRVELRAAAPDVFGPAEISDIDTLTAGQTALCSTHRRYMEDRETRGYVRDCHGDLHLGNICLYEGRATIFDAIEFNDSFNHTDVLYDLAFILMDLAQRGDTQAANAVFNRYLHKRADYSGLRLLPLFQSVRAAVRAHVSAKAATEQPDAAARAESAAAARAYLRFAADLLEEPEPRLIAVGGYSGTGKTTVAHRLAPLTGAIPGAVVVSSDLLRKRRFSVEPTDRLDKSAYSEEISDEVYGEMRSVARSAIEEGFSVLCDATFITPGQRDGIEDLAREMAVPFDGVWLTGDAEILAGRIDRRRNDASDATAEILHKQLETGPGDMRWREVSATDPSRDAFETIRGAL